jgi:hypothetical protein
MSPHEIFMMPTRQSRFFCRQFWNHIQIADTKNGRRSTEKMPEEIFYRHYLLKYAYSSLSLDLSLFLYIDINIYVYKNIYIYTVYYEIHVHLYIFYLTFRGTMLRGCGVVSSRLASWTTEKGHWNLTAQIWSFQSEKPFHPFLVPSGESCSDRAEIFSVAFFNYLKPTIFYALILFFSRTGKSY